ncbi:hypothetical protein [Streptomyces cucumeris]|uniref:hypothetical protein n=1 Tax=Streptomyces cucumeris TaxID=2962890 RepID=UPI0020C872FB|nr:hypothetical protein [Streptomyces sp. NEAU-Y11]MCP9212356.1 hypothetical protein [Streptomyces sp. NEAU-Y11]
MKERKDKYRAALDRSADTATARSARVTTLHSRFVRVTIEVDPDVERSVTRWVGPPLSALALAGTTVLRTLADTAARVPRAVGGARRSEP